MPRDWYWLVDIAGDWRVTCRVSSATRRLCGRGRGGRKTTRVLATATREHAVEVLLGRDSLRKRRRNCAREAQGHAQHERREGLHEEPEEKGRKLHLLKKKRSKIRDKNLWTIKNKGRKQVRAQKKDTYGLAS